MMPNFNQMPDDQLREYIKRHRADDKAISELFVNRRSSDDEATWYSTAGIKDTVDVIQKELGQRHARGPHAS